MNFNIEKGIAVTPIKGDPTQDKYGDLPLAQMISGDSIFVPLEFAKPNNVSTYASVYGRKNNLKFITRKEGTGTRIFKIENY